MQPLQLQAVLDEHLKLDLELVPQAELWRRLAHSIRHNTGAERVSVLAAFVERGDANPAPELPLIAVDSAAAAEPPRVLRELAAPELARHWLGEQPVFADLRELAYRVAEPAAAGAAPALHVRVRGAHHIAWWRVELRSGLEEGEALRAWAAALQRLTRLVAQPQDAAGSLLGRSARMRYSQELLDTPPRGDAQDFRALCQAWKRAGEADWVWLWLYNRHTNEYELSACCDGSPALEQRMAPSADGIGHYCREAGRAEIAEDIAGWRGRIAGREYRIVLADFLIAQGCQSLICVPLFAAPGADARAEAEVHVVTLHYRERARRRPMDERALLQMGRRAAHFLMAARRERREQIREELNRLTETHLAGLEREQAVVLEEYLRELVALLQRRLRALGVSIFLKALFEDAVRCYASTGLVDAEGHEVAPSEYPSVRYQAGEGMTGKCYASNEMLSEVDPRDDPEHRWKYREKRPHPPRSAIDPCLLCPIPTQRVSEAGLVRPIGVIRLAGHDAELLPGHDRPFDPDDAETLAFIARQIGPTLQILLAGVAREGTIAILRHDLAAPLVMIRDTIDRVLHPREDSAAPRAYDLQNIETSCLLATGLVAQLTRREAEFKRIRPEPTLLEGDLIARLKNTLRHYAWRSRKMRIHFGDQFRSIPKLLIDRELIERVFQNLIVNAIKYGAEGSTIEIEARTLPLEYVVDVSNYGMGVDEEERQRIFLPFYRSDKARRSSVEGVGLGLSISRQAMAAHGGELRLTALRDPTVFSLHFPKKLLFVGK